MVVRLKILVKGTNEALSSFSRVFVYLLRFMGVVRTTHQRYRFRRFRCQLDLKLCILTA